MKFRFLALLALVLGMASCQKDTYGLDVDANGEAAVTISVALPDVETRAGGNDSAIGAFGNVDLTKYDVRYILEVYNLAKAYRLLPCMAAPTSIRRLNCSKAVRTLWLAHRAACSTLSNAAH